MFKRVIEKVKVFFVFLSNFCKAHGKELLAVALILLMALVMVYCLSSCSHFSMKVDEMKGAEMTFDKDIKDDARALTDCLERGLPFRASNIEFLEVRS